MTPKSSAAPVKREASTIDNESDQLIDDEVEFLLASEGDDVLIMSGQYDEASEKLPQAAAYDSEFPKLLRDVHKILEGVLDALRDSGRDHPTFKVIFDKAEKLIADPSKPKRKINIIGISGAGKSSLLNSLLGRPDATRSSGAGKGCTQVPTTYTSRFTGQTKPFAAKLDLFTQAENRGPIDTMLQNYNLYHFAEEEEWSPDDEAGIDSAASTAFEAFRTLFCTKTEFLSPEAGHHFLSQASQQPRSATTDLLTSWCGQLLDEHCPEVQGASGFEEVDTQQDLLDYLAKFTLSRPTYKQPSMWPLVKMIRQGLDVDLLRYVDLVDWPGSDDINQLRAKASADRIADCDEIWIVGDAARIIDHPSVKSNLLRYGKTIRCLVICTCIDLKLDQTLADDVEAADFDTGTYRAFREEQRRLERVIDLNTAKISKLADALRADNNIGPSSKRQKLAEDKKAACETRKEQLEAELDSAQQDIIAVNQNCFESLIAARKVYVLGELENRLKSGKLTTEMPEVHFAANTHYSACKGGAKIAGPRLSPVDTGIPALRSHIQSAAAPGILSNFQDRVDSDMQAFLYGIIMILTPAKLRNYKDVLSMVKEKQQRISPFRESYMQMVKDSVDENLTTPLRDRQQQFADAASKILEGKKALPYKSIGAFVRKDGCHTIKKTDYQSWNDQFMERAANLIEKSWNSLIIDEQEALQSITKMLIEECNDISVMMKQNPAMMVLSTDALDKYLQGQVEGIRGLSRDAGNALSKDLG